MVVIDSNYLLGLAIALLAWLNARIELVASTQRKHIKLAKKMHPKECKELGL